MINDSGVLCSGSYGKKSEIGTLIRNAALRGEWRVWFQQSEFHIMMEYVSRDVLCTSEVVRLGHVLFFSHFPLSLALNAYKSTFWKKGIWGINSWLLLFFRAIEEGAQQHHRLCLQATTKNYSFACTCQLSRHNSR